MDTGVRGGVCWSWSGRRAWVEDDVEETKDRANDIVVRLLDGVAAMDGTGRAATVALRRRARWS